MCGRYTLGRGETSEGRFGFYDWAELRLPPRFNIAPSQLIFTLVQRREAETPQPALMRWGFAPAWLQHRDQVRAHPLPPPINAMAEHLLDRPMWRGVLRRNRCLVLADGFYEWQATPGRGSTAFSVGGQRRASAGRKQPLYITRADGAVFAMAGLYAQDADGNDTCVVVTTRPNSLMAPIHHRMPAILRPEDEAIWLDPAEDHPAALLPCLEPYPAEEMRAVPVSPAVNNVRNDGPELVEPLASCGALD